MNLTTIVVTRNAACHIKTLHTMLRLNLMCLGRSVRHNIVFVIDDPHTRAESIMKHLKTSDRLFFIDYGVFVDYDTLEKIFCEFNGFGCLIFPCVTDGVNWDMFRKKVTDDSDEPEDQMALNFDTELGQKVGESMYRVQSTNPRSWVMESKSVVKCLREKKGDNLKLPAKNSDMFTRLNERGLKINAWTASRLTVTFQHECISNILESAGIKSVQ